MAVYVIDHTSTTTMLESIRDGLTAAGILTTNHRDTSTNLIVTTTRSTRPIRFNISGSTTKRIYIYYGTGYTSGDVVDNSVTLQAHASNTGDAGALIVTSDMFGVFQRRGSGNTYGFICSKLLNAPTNTQIMWAWTATVSSTLLHDADALAQMEAAFYRKQIISSGDNYYFSQIPCMTGGDYLLSMGLAGVQALHRGPNYTAAYEISGDDVVVPGGRTNGDDAYMPCSLYIPEGNSWAPAP